MVHASSTQTPRQLLAAGAIGALVAAALGLAAAQPSAQRQAATGMLAGVVTTHPGEVRGLRVKASDTVHRIAYTVFTNKGRYQFFNLPPSSYRVQVFEEAFDSPTETVDVKAGQTTTLNIAITARAAAAGAGAGARGSIAQTSYGRTAEDHDPSQVELVDFDVLYPPGPTRDLIVKECFGCHGISGWHGRKLNRAGWTRVVNRMFAPDGRVANLAPGVPIVTYNRVPMQQKEAIIDYLTANFGPASKPRDLRIDAVQRDEDALAGAIYVEYELSRTLGPKFANNLEPTPGGHSAFASLATPGVVWFSGNSSNSIVRVDTRDLNFATRTKEYWVANAARVNTTPHGIVEREGLVWFVELGGDHVSRLDPKTGRIERSRIPTEGAGPHSVWPDSKGNLWYTYFASSGRVARYDAKTQQVREWEVGKDFSGYGIIVDKQDRVWAVSLNTPAVMGYDPASDRWTSYAISGPARRVAVDSKGNIWACEYFDNKIAMIDPTSGRVTEYSLPLKWGNPYDLWPDAEDNIWIENAVYNSLVKFDPRTGRFSYVPFPQFAAHTPKLDRDKEGTLWFTLGRPTRLTGFKPKGNVPEAGRDRAQ